MVPGQFGAGQFGADNSARTIRRWTIRRPQFTATIRLAQFGAKYDINFIESSAFIQRYSFHQFRSKILFINPASISAIFFINPASISAIFFSPIPFGTRHYELGLLIDEKILLKWNRDWKNNIAKMEAKLIENIAEMEAE